MRRHRHVGLGLVIATLGLVGAACSDDESSDTASTTADPDTDGGEGGSELAAFCDGFITLVDGFQDGEIPPPGDGEALVAAVEENAPDEIAEPMGVVVAAAREALGGDEEAFDDAFFESLAEVDAYRSTAARPTPASS